MPVCFTIDPNWSEFATRTVATLVGVFAGAGLAYLTEHWRERRYDLRARAAAVNLATLALSQMYSALIQYQRQIIEPTRSDPNRWCTMRPSDLPSANLPDFDYPALGFMFKSKNPSVLGKLATEARSFAYVRDLAARRTLMHLTELQPAIERTGAAPPHTVALIERAAGPRLVHVLREYTQGLIDVVDSAVNSIEALQKDLREAAIPMVGKEKLIWFVPDFTRPSPPSGPST